MTPHMYTITAPVWLYSGDKAAWHFVSIPKEESSEIEREFDALKGGWGSLPVLVTIGKSSWKTSIFPDKKSGEYLLPLKTEIRKKEGIKNGDTIRFFLDIQV